MNQDNTQNGQATEVTRAMSELVAWRGARFDKQDSIIWLERLDEHNHSGLTLEAARRFGEDESLQDTPVTLAAFLRVVKAVRNERISMARDSRPQPPSGIGDDEYRVWLAVCNEGAVRGLSSEQIDHQARKAINAPDRQAISGRPAPVMYLPPTTSEA